MDTATTGFEAGYADATTSESTSGRARMKNPPNPFGRLIVGRSEGDVIAGNHLRDFGIEEKAAAEALRHLLTRTEPKETSWLVFKVREGQWRNALSDEVERHYRWRVYAHWLALRFVFAARRDLAAIAGKARRPRAGSPKAARGRKAA